MPFPTELSSMTTNMTVLTERLGMVAGRLAELEVALRRDAAGDREFELQQEKRDLMRMHGALVEQLHPTPATAEEEARKKAARERDQLIVEMQCREDLENLELNAKRCEAQSDFAAARKFRQQKLLVRENVMKMYGIK